MSKSIVMPKGVSEIKELFAGCIVQETYTEIVKDEEKKTEEEVIRFRHRALSQEELNEIVSAVESIFSEKKEGVKPVASAPAKTKKEFENEELDRQIAEEEKARLAKEANASK